MFFFSPCSFWRSRAWEIRLKQGLQRKLWRLSSTRMIQPELWKHLLMRVWSFKKTLLLVFNFCTLLCVFKYFLQCSLLMVKLHAFNVFWLPWKWSGCCSRCYYSGPTKLKYIFVFQLLSVYFLYSKYLFSHHFSSLFCFLFDEATTLNYLFTPAFFFNHRMGVKKSKDLSFTPFLLLSNPEAVY